MALAEDKIVERTCCLVGICGVRQISLHMQTVHEGQMSNNIKMKPEQMSAHQTMIQLMHNVCRCRGVSLSEGVSVCVQYIMV